MHACTCPRCGTPHVEYGRNRVHQCTCGLTLHRPRELRLPGKGSMGALKAGGKLVLYRLAVFLSLSVALFSHDHHKLHAARFARLHELSQLSAPPLRIWERATFRVSSFNHFACVRPTKTRSELGNLLICAPTRAGKGLLAVSQLLVSGLRYRE